MGLENREMQASQYEAPRKKGLVQRAKERVMLASVAPVILENDTSNSEDGNKIQRSYEVAEHRRFEKFLGHLPTPVQNVTITQDAEAQPPEVYRYKRGKRKGDLRVETREGEIEQIVSQSHQAVELVGGGAKEVIVLEGKLAVDGYVAKGESKGDGDLTVNADAGLLKASGGGQARAINAETVEVSDSSSFRKSFVEIEGDVMEATVNKGNMKIHGNADLVSVGYEGSAVVDGNAKTVEASFEGSAEVKGTVDTGRVALWGKITAESVKNKEYTESFKGTITEVGKTKGE